MNPPLHRRLSLTLRLTLLFAAASTAVLLVLGTLIGRAVERHFEEDDLHMLAGKLELVRHAVEKLRSPDDQVQLEQQLAAALVGHHGLEVMITTVNGHTLFATPDAAFPPALLQAGLSERPQPQRWHNGAPQRGIAALAETGMADARMVIIALSSDITHHEHFMAAFRSTLWRFGALAALLIGVLGWFAVRRGLAPLQAMRQQAADIDAGRLHARLPADAVPAELADLANSLNDMLARLEASFQRLSDFSSDLAHELRTPVSNLLTQTQVTLTRARTVAEYQDVLASNAEEFERLSRIIADMLFLAKADNQLLVPHREPVDLHAEAVSVCEFYEALAEEKGVRIACQGSATVQGDRLMLRRALNNLVSNAVRHTPVGGEVTVHVAALENEIHLTVENTGDPIAAEHLPRLFDRFYRADPARQHLGEGAGLGLAITRSIVHAHGGEISVRSAEGRTAFEVCLPIIA